MDTHLSPNSLLTKTILSPLAYNLPCHKSGVHIHTPTGFSIFFHLSVHLTRPEPDSLNRHGFDSLDTQESSPSPHWSAPASLTKQHRRGPLNHRNLFSRSSGGRKSKTKLSTGPYSQRRLVGTIIPCPSQLPAHPAISWLVAT